VILTDIKAPQASYELLVAKFGEAKVIAPSVLRTVRRADVLAEG